MGKAHCLAKTTEASLSDKDYRILVVLQRVYRWWASMRLQHLSGWVSRWQHPQMYAGVKGAGADVAWLSTALDQEEAHLQLVAYLMGMVDIYKCFDQIVPVLAHIVCAIAGMPVQVLWAYIRLMRKIQVINCLALGADQSYRLYAAYPKAAHGQ